MNKVLVDRELLERIANKAAFLHDTRKDQDKLAAILAQSEEVEEVENSKLEKLKDYAALQAECERLRKAIADKVVAETMITGMIAGDDGVSIGLEGGASKILADAFGQQLVESGAINYIELTFESREYPEIGQITVTVKNELGKTPHQLRVIAETELAKWQKCHETIHAPALNDAYALIEELRAELDSIKAQDPS